MPLTTIYITRHGHRSNWNVDHQTGVYTASYPTPTNNPADPALSSHGVRQSHELARHLLTLEPSPFKGARRKDGVGFGNETGFIYCSPYYRCLQTMAPTVDLLHQNDNAKDVMVRGETGIGEWYGSAPFEHPSPSPTPLLRTFFPFLSPTYTPRLIPNIRGESIGALHDRVALALETLVADVDSEISRLESDSQSQITKPQEYAILICSHAAPIIAMGRALTGHMPADISIDDFKPFTCGLSKFIRRTQPSATTASPSSNTPFTSQTPHGTLPRTALPPDWRDGKGVAGGWDCVLNGDCSFLSGGEERGWHFTGEEDFDTGPGPADGRGVTGGLGLGAVDGVDSGNDCDGETAASKL